MQKQRPSAFLTEVANQILENVCAHSCMCAHMQACVHTRAPGQRTIIQMLLKGNLLIQCLLMTQCPIFLF